MNIYISIDMIRECACFACSINYTSSPGEKNSASYKLKSEQIFIHTYLYYAVSSSVLLSSTPLSCVPPLSQNVRDDLEYLLECRIKYY